MGDECLGNHPLISRQANEQVQKDSGFRRTVLSLEMNLMAFIHKRECYHRHKCHGNTGLAVNVFIFSVTE